MIAVGWLDAQKNVQWCRADSKTTVDYEDHVSTRCKRVVTLPVSLLRYAEITCPECRYYEELLFQDDERSFCPDDCKIAAENLRIDDVIRVHFDMWTIDEIYIPDLEPRLKPYIEFTLRHDDGRVFTIQSRMKGMLTLVQSCAEKPTLTTEQRSALDLARSARVLGVELETLARMYSEDDLHHLVEHGFLTLGWSRIDPEIPPQTAYFITSKGAAALL